MNKHNHDIIHKDYYVTLRIQQGRLKAAMQEIDIKAIALVNTSFLKFIM